MSNLQLNNVAETNSDLLSKKISTMLKDYFRVSGEVTMLEAEYENILEGIKKTNKRLAEASRTLESKQKLQAKLKTTVEDWAREHQVSAKVEGASVSYSNPTEKSYDVAKLLDIYPTANDIPRLLRTVVDVEMMEAATAAGMIPEDIESECRVETPRYRNGRVQVKVKKKA